jgi:hypothetical protein
VNVGNDPSLHVPSIAADLQPVQREPVPLLPQLARLRSERA